MPIELLIIIAIFAVLAVLNVIIVVKFKNKQKLNFENFANEYSDRFLDILTGVITILSVNKDQYESEEAYEQAIIDAAAKEIVDTFKDSIDDKYKKILNQELVERILTDIINRYNLLEEKRESLE